ncbi:MAG: hypothetical protein KIG95_12395 [Comamonas sp.]|nr:hypothetical protein [Comamonas sp.]
MAACAALSACSTAPIPVAHNFEYTTQAKARSAGHWQLMARDIVVQTLQTLEGVGVARTEPVYVTLPEQDTDFERGLRQFLITGLVQSGVSVLDKPEGSRLHLSYQSQVVVHHSARPHFIPGQFTVLTAGLMAAYGLHHAHLDAKLLAGLGLAGAADVANSQYSGGPTHTEVILTTSVLRPEHGQFLARKTDVYYLEDVDAPLFAAPPAPLYPPKTLNVVD